MEKQILKDCTPEDRLEQLRMNAEKAEPFTYTRELEQGEIDQLQTNLSQALITIDKEDQKLKAHKESYNAVVKPLRGEIGESLQKIRTRSEEVHEDVFLLKDVQENKMGYYSKEGVLVWERNLRPDEMQFSITEHLRKTS